MVGEVGGGVMTEALKLAGEGLEPERAVLQAHKNSLKRSAGETYEFYKDLFGESFASDYVKPSLSAEPFLADDPDTLFKQLCEFMRNNMTVGDYLDLAARLLHTPPLNRLITESLITVSEEDEKVYTEIWVPKSLAGYVGESGHLKKRKKQCIL